MAADWHYSQTLPQRQRNCRVDRRHGNRRFSRGEWGAQDSRWIRTSGRRQTKEWSGYQQTEKRKCKGESRSCRHSFVASVGMDWQIQNMMSLCSYLEQQRDFAHAFLQIQFRDWRRCLLLTVIYRSLMENPDNTLQAHHRALPSSYGKAWEIIVVFDVMNSKPNKSICLNNAFQLHWLNCGDCVFLCSALIYSQSEDSSIVQTEKDCINRGSLS